MRKLTETEIIELAEEALNAACLHIQDAIGQDDGGVAALYFSGDRARDMFAAYIRSEIAMAEPMPQGWRKAFPDFDPATLPAIPADWRDTSYANDTCPSFATPFGHVVFIDYADVALREYPESPSRFYVQADSEIADHNEQLFESNDWRAVLWFVCDPCNAIFAVPPRIGARFFLRHAVDRFPHFVAPVNATGTIVAVDSHAIAGKMDSHIAGAEEWDNCVVWDRLSDAPEESALALFRGDAFVIMTD